MKRYVGLDVHSKFTVFVIQEESGKVIARGEAETTREGLAQIAAAAGASPEATLVGLETGVQAKWVARELERLGLEPVVLDAREVRAKARRMKQKTDRRDAFEICDGLRRDQFLTRVWVPGATIETLRALLSRRRHFVGKSTSQVNAAKFVLRHQGKARPKTMKTARAWSRLEEREDLDELTRASIGCHRALWEVIQEQIAALEVRIEAAMEPLSDVARLLQTVHGVGPIVSAGFVAALGDPGRFENSNQVVSYLGLAPSSYDSGGRERHGSITKQGCAPARALLIEAAHHARNPRHPLHPYWAPIAAVGGKKKAAVAVAGRLARILWRLWRDGEPFDVRKLNVVYQPGVRSRPVYYRKRKPREVAA